MKWTPGTQNDDVVDERGASGGDGGGGGWGGGGLRLGGGGVAVVIVVVLVARVFGVDVSGLFGGGGGGGGGSTGQQTEHRPAGPDPDAGLVDYVRFVMKDVQDTFESMFKADGKPYRHAKLVLFTRGIDTGCGHSTSAIGPFYCPADEHAYIDLSFYRELKQRFGAPGDFAQAYVLAHELGHHLQKLMGIEANAGTVSRDRHSRNDASVRLELQADCFAGVWGHAAQGKHLLEQGDLEQALTAASAIGDDRLQQQAGERVNPETFTHGTSAQRVKWFRRGFESGRFDACDTFTGNP